MQDQLPITYEEMRGLVVEALALTSAGQTGNLEDLVAGLASKRGYVQGEQRQSGVRHTMRSHAPEHLSKKDYSVFQNQ